MVGIFRHIKIRVAFFMSVVLMLSACEKQHQPSPPVTDDTRRDNAMILFCAGFNNLSGNMRGNINTLLRSYVPPKDSSLLFIYSHLLEDGYDTPTSPTVTRVYRDKDCIVKDTVLIFPKGATSADKEVLSTMLTYLSGRYNAGNWGMIFSGHGTAYLPAGFYDSSHSWADSQEDIYIFATRKSQSGPKPLMWPDYVEGWTEKDPLVKTINAEYGFEGGQRVTRELSVQDLAAAIPIRMKYILMDECLMGNVESAYELRNVCDLYGASPTEIMSSGFDYSNITKYLLCNETPDVKSVLEKYVDHYIDIRSYASISLVDCRELDNLAAVCARLFSAHRDELDNVNYTNVQRYFRKGFYQGGHTMNPHWFYDLGSIMKQLNLSPGEKADFDTAFDKAVIFKKSTEKFNLTGGFVFSDFNGLSMYLPCNGDPDLNLYYKELSWNTATSLVK